MKFNQAQKILMSSSLTVFLAGCGAPNFSPSETHITVEEVDSERHAEPENIPSLVKSSPATPSFSETKNFDTFDVVVTNVPVRDLLFALARDSGINMDVDDNVGGLITMSALDQSLDAILARIKEQVPIRVEHVGDAIIVKQDTPYTKIYRVDFLNISRAYTSATNTSGVGAGEGSVTSTAETDFWQGLEASIASILGAEYVQPEIDGAVAGLPLADEEDELNAERLQQVTDADLRPAGAPGFYLNPETGVLTVHASERSQKLIQELLDSTMSIAKRQVLLEATVVEVVLNNQYSQGIDWALFNSLASEGLSLYQGANIGGAAAALAYLTEEFNFQAVTEAFDTPEAARTAAREALERSLGTYDRVTEVSTEIEVTEVELTDASGENAILRPIRLPGPDGELNTTDDVTGSAPAVQRQYEATIDATIERLQQSATDRTAGGLSPNTPNNGLFQAAFRQGDLSAAVSLLDSFGDAKVLSSPRISALNYQPALLRVVDQEVYFDIEVEEEIDEATGQVTERTFDVSENTVDIGFAMNVLPQISADGEVVLNLKPSVTRVLDYRQGFVPTALGGAQGQLQNLIPITRVRELESVISLRDGEVAVLGGLLEDRTGDNNQSVPGLGKLPGVGVLFSKRDESTYKTEFVVFIRARIIKNPSINGDYSHLRHLLPNTDFIIRDAEGTFLPPQQLDK